MAVASGFCSAVALFISCATAPEKGFLPLVIEPPVAYSEPRGFTGADASTSKVYIRNESKKGEWPMARNAGASFAYEPEEGVISWYGYDHIGRKTADGGYFNPEEMVAAHKELPFGTVVRVTRLDNGDSVVVTIKDRGPYIDGRIIDLSRKAAKELGLLNKGIAKGRVEVLRYPLVEKRGPRGNG
jgi:rare lipoprotein A